ncbi:MAG: HIRAN domain-containing protein [Bacilli bacterium]
MNPTSTRRRTVMLLAHSLRAAHSWPMSVALRWAWRIEKSDIAARVAGVRFGQRQTALEHLSRYAARDTFLSLRRESQNPHDRNAVAIIVTVAGRGSVRVGYLAAATARVVAPLMDRGLLVRVGEWAITSGDIMGLRLRLTVGGATRFQRTHIRIA